MDDIIYYILLSFIAGILVKVVDDIDDEAKSKSWIKWPLAIIYGGLIGFLISQAPFAMIFLGCVMSQIFMKKVDTASHKIAYLVMVISMLYFGLPVFLLFPLAVFLIFSSLDELDHLIFWDKPEWVADFRPFLEIAAVPFIFTGQWYYFAGLISFDIGYLSGKFMFDQRLKPKIESN